MKDATPEYYLEMLLNGIRTSTLEQGQEIIREFVRLTDYNLDVVARLETALKESHP